MAALATFIQSILCCEVGSLSISPGDDDLQGYSFHDCFELGEVLGEGGYAVVHMATNVKNHTKVAVKIAKKAHIDAGKESAMRREFQILRSLNHPNIVRAIGLFEESNDFFVVLEYMEGGELFDRIVKKTQYSEKEARDAVRCIVWAVEYLHRHDIVHRDLKPENLLLARPDDDSTLKIADFGLARVVSGNGIVGKAGTPEYWAPEVLESKACGKPVDMWAVGVITFVLLGGYAPFHHRDPQVMYANISKGVFKFHPQRWANVSNEAKAFICALLNTDPEKRLTASEALLHPWLNKSDEILQQRNLLDNLDEMRKYNSMRKFRGGIQAIRGMQKLIKIVRTPKSSQSTPRLHQEDSFTSSTATAASSAASSRRFHPDELREDETEADGKEAASESKQYKK